MDFLEQSENNTALFNWSKVFLIGKYKLKCIKKLAMNKKHGDLYVHMYTSYMIFLLNYRYGSYFAKLHLNSAPKYVAGFQ